MKKLPLAQPRATTLQHECGFMRLRKPLMKKRYIIALVLAGLCGHANAERPTAPSLRQHERATAQSNPAPFLTWLGPVPFKLSRNVVNQRFAAVHEKIELDLKTQSDVGNFVCKKPDEVGPVPMMDVVNQYIDELPESQSDEPLLRRLDEAARQGNWLARVQIYAMLSERNGTNEITHYRTVQLMEWLQQRQIGTLYAFFGDDLAASGYYSDAPHQAFNQIDVFAALHHSYPSQNKVGEALATSSDPHLARIGEKMRDCASQALPSYARIFSGAAATAQAERDDAREKATYSPLHHAILAGDATLVKQLVAQPGVDVNAKAGDEQTPLAMALSVAKPNTAIVKFLIDGGAEVALHGPVNPNAGIYNAETLLNRAVKAEPADLDLIGMLVKAGAEPFQTGEVLHFVSGTPFANAFEPYASGRNTAILDFFLAMKTLDPQSELAQKYLEHAAGYLPVMERLLAYGISPERPDRLLPALASESGRRTPTDVQRYMTATAALVTRYPGVAQALKRAPGYRALAGATHDCNFKFANLLLDLGAPVDKPGDADPGELVATVVGRCARIDSNTDDPGTLAASTHARKTFLENLHARKYNFNVDTGRPGDSCPAWSTYGGLCQVPEGDELARQFLSMGADPYLLYKDQRGSALASAIASCRVGVVNAMLAQGPRQQGPATQAALDLALIETTRKPWEGLNCPGNFMADTARTLLAYGAHPERPH